ncbi:MAG: hypothetical protein GTO24_27935 [candidate division Zixibacteria bacterium]|nr:hypothetical protein [candidate division Zixibacteria bacterium]
MAKYLPLSILILFLVVGCNPVKESPQEIGGSTFIQIKLEGGGFYGGYNPVTENIRTIKTTGEILIHTKQLYTGDRDVTLFTSRDEVEKLAGFILDNGFFTLKDMYDCDPSNEECNQRKKEYPPAIPLQVDVTIGNMRKSVTVTVFEKGMIDYPESFEAIVDRINELIARAGEQD